MTSASTEGAPAPSDRFGLLAAAFAGRRLAVVCAGEGPPSTDGVTLWVPAHAAERALVPVIVQAGLLAIGSLHPRFMTRLVGRRSATARFAVLEAGRLVGALGHRMPSAVERELRALGESPAPASAAESLERALGREDVAIAPWTVGVVRPALILKGRATSGEDAAGDPLADERLKRLREVTREMEEADDEDDERRRNRDLLTSALGRNPLSRLLRDLMTPESASASDPSAGGAELDVGGMRRVREMGTGGRISTHSASLLAEADDAPSGTEHPEWDCRRTRYRPAHCSVHHMDPAPPDAPQSLRVDADVALRRTVARIGLALERHGRLTDGEDLDLRALVDFAVARVAGEHIVPRVHESRRPTAHDLGVVVLLDASGSTSDDRAAGGRIWDEQRRLAAALIDAFEHAGDRVASYAFRSYGRRDIRFLRVKHFDDRFDRGAQRRLIDLQPAGYTRLGAAVRHASLLAREASGTSRHLLVLISDGLPYEDDYTSRYAEEDTRVALQEAVSAGVGCVCLSVGSSQDDAALQRVWGAFNHLHIDDAQDVAPQAEALVRSALKAALAASHGLAAPPRRAA